MQTASANDPSLNTEIKKLVTLAWPLLIAQVTQTLMGVSDSIMAGRYSSTDLAGVAVGVNLMFPLMVFIQGLSLALSPQIARLNGAKSPDQMPVWVHQTLYLTISASVILISTKWLISPILDMLSMEAELREIVVGYTYYILFALPALAIYQSLRNFCEGLSKTRPTMIIMFTGLIVNIPANYIFINGLFGLPEMGGVGCGLATMLVIYTMAIATFLYTVLGKSFESIKIYHNFELPDFKKVFKLIKMGLPIAFTLLAEVTLFASASVLLSTFGAKIVAAHQIALNFSSLIFMLPLSIGLAVAIRIGFNIGNNAPLSAHKAYQAALITAISTVVFTATITVIGATFIASLYSKETYVIEIAAGLLLFAAVFQFSDSIQVVGANALRGYKDNKAMLIISITAYWGIGFPTAVLLGLTDYIVPKMAAEGFWIGFIIGLSAAAIMMTARVLHIQRNKQFNLETLDVSKD